MSTTPPVFGAADHLISNQLSNQLSNQMSTSCSEAELVVSSLHVPVVDECHVRFIRHLTTSNGRLFVAEYSGNHFNETITTANTIVDTSSSSAQPSSSSSSSTSTIEKNNNKQLVFVKDFYDTRLFKNELCALKTCQNKEKHIIPVLAILSETSILFPLMKCNLHELIWSSEQKTIPYQLRIKWARQLCIGLAHIHSCQYIHCDIKPSNLLVDENNDLYIADFGTSHPLGEYLIKSEFFSTWPYSASNDWPHTFMFDIHSLGFTLVSILFGLHNTILLEWKKMLKEQVLFEIRKQKDVFGETWEWTSEMLERIADLLIRCTHQDPKQRPSLDEISSVFCNQEEE
jgi:hypothetical protein